MNTEILFYIIIGILTLQFILETYLDYLNSKHYKDAIPTELSDVYDGEEYVKSQDYTQTN
jgi:STE24 endopeptidase